MAELRFGGRCSRHPLNILPCEKCATEQPQTLTLRDVLHRLHSLIGDGTQKAAAEKLGVSQQYLSDVLNESREPGPLILAGLGIERVVTYRTCGVAACQHGVPHRWPCEKCDGAGVPEDGGMRAAMVKLSRALGHPMQVDAAEGQCIEAALIELAAQRIAGVPGTFNDQQGGNDA